MDSVVASEAIDLGSTPGTRTMVNAEGLKESGGRSQETEEEVKTRWARRTETE